jgi:serine/threonine-protein kinase
MTAGLFGAAYPLIFTVDELLFHLLGGARFQLHVGHAVAISMVSISLLVLWAARSERISPPRLLDLAVMFQAIGAIGIGLGSLDPTEPSFYTEGVQLWGISWVAVWILAFPFLVPMAPGRTALSSLIAAVTGSIALVYAVQFSSPEARGTGDIVRMIYPQFVVAAIATLGARLIFKMRRDLEHAIHMGSYRLERPLGQGGMGQVWLARHQMLARPAAVKLILPEAIERVGPAGSALLRFEREARATSELTSPHSVQIFDFGIADSGVFYYVMELLDGPTLEQFVKEHGPMPPERTVHILIQICDALADAHERGLIHRDMKPANVMLCRRGLEADFVKVMDFGMVAERRDGIRLTGEHSFAGTAGYIAPEVARGEAIDARADLYAVGAIAYWLLTAERTFTGETPLAVVLRQIQDDPPPPSQRVGIPAWLDAIVMRCLSRNPEERPQSARELQQLLTRGELASRWTRERAEAWWETLRPSV